MLMASKYDSYCKECGRPIFKGDLMEYIPETKIVLCVCCHVGLEKERECPHWAFSCYYEDFTPSNRYKCSHYNNNRSSYVCLNCRTEFRSLPKINTHYIQYNVSLIHGKSPYKGFKINSFINKGKFNQPKNPDDKSLIALQMIIETPDTFEDVKDIAFNHIERINRCNNSLIIDISDLENCIENSIDMEIYKWLYQKNEEFDIFYSAVAFFKDVIQNDTSYEIKETKEIINSFKVENLSILTTISILGCVDTIFDKKIDNCGNDLADSISDLLVDLINIKSFTRLMQNSLNNICSILGISPTFYKLLKKYLSNHSEQIKMLSY